MASASAALTRHDLADPLRLLGGLPFLDEGFRHGRLLAGAAAVRHTLARQQGGARGDMPPQGWLTPSAVYALRNSPPMPARPLPPVRRAAITSGLAELEELVPAWMPLLRLPVRYARLFPDRGAISASSRAWPQHVLLAEAAFSTAAELREQLVHELAHQWLYLIQEMWRLAPLDAPTVTLPSGTAGRSPDEALGAAHVAAALIRLYRATGDHDRVRALTAYGTGCLGTARRLTPAGQLLCDHIAAHLTDPGSARAG
ncbi:HEXXH motif-containing putative peptide modification protein [Actinomadura sp. NPDC048394]|uniref:aKG-HExxH-type peptide beta-hydroxylase n=1 Tax=Actinomadura sp. NPDC048394 TaxID=3158223 RepID=UPI0033D5D6D7